MYCSNSLNEVSGVFNPQFKCKPCSMIRGGRLSWKWNILELSLPVNLPIRLCSFIHKVGINNHTIQGHCNEDIT